MEQAAKQSALYMTCILGLAVSAASHAELKYIDAGVTPKLVYTDNLCLSADNTQSDLYAEIQPYVSIGDDLVRGKRANFTLDASAEVNSLTTSDLESKCDRGFNNRDQFAPRLNARADAVLVEQWLFINADVTASQNDVSPFVSGGGDTADRTGNTNTTYRYSINPYISRRFKDVANLLLSYNYDDQYNTKDIVGDSSQETWLLTFGSGPVFSPVSWSLQGDYQTTDYTDTPGRPTNNDSELSSAQLNLAYQINRKWQINGFVGEEWNDFVSSRDDIDGTFWGAGVRWTPNERTSVDVGMGDRFFGNAPWLTISHRHKRSLFSVDYRKTLTYTRDIRTLGVEDGVEQPGNPTSLSNSPILDERLTLAYAYDGRRSSVGISGSYSDQTREAGTDRNEPVLDLNEATYKNLSLSLRRSLSNKLSLSGRLSWYEQEPKGESSQIAQSSETWRAILGAQHSLGQNTILSLDYQYTDRQSDNAFNEYQENRITLSVRINLL